MMKNIQKISLEKAFPYILITSGMLGLLASFALTIDKIKILKDPNYIPDCNINPIFSCGSVMNSPQAEFLGVPNTIFGIVAFSVILTVGFGLIFGAKYKPLFWKLFNLGIMAGLGGVIYLFYQGVYRINAICPWCALTWVVVIALTMYVTLWNLRNKHLIEPKQLKKPVAFLQKNHTGVLLLIYVAIIVLLLNHFWYYFGN